MGHDAQKRVQDDLVMRLEQHLTECIAVLKNLPDSDKAPEHDFQKVDARLATCRRLFSLQGESFTSGD